MKTATRIVAGLIAGLLCCATALCQQEPAGEGRRISPAGVLLLDAATRLPAVGALPTVFLRSPDHSGKDGQGRYLLVMYSGYGVQFSADTNHAQQSVGVIDLNALPLPVVIQNVYFPTPQSANVGIAFSPAAQAGGAYDLYVSGGYENKVWIFRFDPHAAAPVQPDSPGPDTKVHAPFIDIANPGEASPADYNDGKAALYPTGIALTPDGETLLAANNLGDNLTIVRQVHGARAAQRVDLHHPEKKSQNIYPYDVVALGRGTRVRAYVSCWNDSSVAVISLAGSPAVRRFISVDRHPTAMIRNAQGTRLFVVNSNADSVSVIDTLADREVERIDVRLAETALVGASPEGLALSADEKTLYVANAHSNAVAVVALSERARHAAPAAHSEKPAASRILGFIPTGQYPSAVAVAAGRLFVGNGKGTGFEASSMQVSNSGRTPNVPNAAFPPEKKPGDQGGQYSGSIVSGNISMIALPGEPALVRYTQQTMQNDGLLGLAVPRLFPGASPIRHVIYVIKENRTYDQVFGDVTVAGNGQPADGDARFAIFGGGAAAQRPGGAAQTVTPNQHALAQRFGLFDRFFVNSEASPDGHNWSTAAFSTDYVDKGFRWEYSDRGRTYDWEGYNRLPDYEPPGNLAVDSSKQDTLQALAELLERHIPYRQGGTDIAEPKTLYLWDAAARAGLTYRNYGEFVSVISAKDVEAARAHREKAYPDISPAVRSVATKQSLEAHHSPSFRSFDVTAPDSMTVECYRAAVSAGGALDPAVTRDNPASACRGNSRFGEWLAEFQSFVAARQAGRGDPLPALSVMRMPNDHTAGMKPGFPTPQFYVAENDYAVGRLIEAVSSSPYWKDTALFFVEDDAQAGPDHVDSHRSVALVVSAYNRPGALIHQFHNTVSLIRTIELLLGMAPMNQLDASAIPMDIFQEAPDLRPYHAVLPRISTDNLVTEKPRDAASAQWMRRAERLDFAHADLSDPEVLNEMIWFACRGRNSAMPAAAQLPVYQAMRLGLQDAEDSASARRADDDDK
ncbi:MAG: hypothetical protein LAN84_02040 [Acidobacteriia bacterium]|nr:hypothetical protein [Terriglobia bacterium]